MTLNPSAGWDEESRVVGGDEKDQREIDHGTCTLSLSISRPSALSPIKRPRKHGQKQAGSSWASPSTSLSLFPAILLSLSLSLSISNIDYSF